MDEREGRITKGAAASTRDPRVRESAVVFGSQGPLVGVLSEPPGGGSRNRPGFILLNSGLVHRVGPNRISVMLARRLARAGFVALRFDHSGVGDSPAARDTRGVAERWVDEIRDAVDHLEAEWGVRGAVVLGNCSGATGGLLAGLADDRIVGVAMLNPPLGSTRYFFRVMRSGLTFWRRLLGGRAKLRLGFKSLFSRSNPDPQNRPPARDGALRGISDLAGRGTRLLIVSSEWDPSYDSIYRGMRHDLERRVPDASIDLEYVPGANHMFSLVRNQKDLSDVVAAWAEEFEAS